MGCDCSGQPFVLKRNTVWNILSAKYPYDLSYFDEIKISFKNSADDSITLTISTLDGPGISHIGIDLATNTIYPVITADDSNEFVTTSLYTFDIALIKAGDVLRRNGPFTLSVQDTITAP